MIKRQEIQTNVFERLVLRAQKELEVPVWTVFGLDLIFLKKLKNSGMDFLIFDHRWFLIDTLVRPKSINTGEIHPLYGDMKCLGKENVRKQLLL